jgi:hypothetical protein
MSKQDELNEAIIYIKNSLKKRSSMDLMKKPTKLLCYPFLKEEAINLISKLEEKQLREDL